MTGSPPASALSLGAWKQALFVATRPRFGDRAAARIFLGLDALNRSEFHAFPARATEKQLLARALRVESCGHGATEVQQPA
jgi:hypothetical protein